MVSDSRCRIIFNINLKKFLFYTKKLEFKVANDVIDDGILGKFQFNSINVQEIFKNPNPVIIDVNVSSCEIYVLPNNMLLSANLSEKSLTLYDEKFNLIKTIMQIDGEDLSPYGISMNEEHKLYISNRDQHRILMTDLEFNKIKMFGSKGNGNNQLNNPYGICYKDGHLYVCDNGNKRVQIFSKDFEHEKSLPVDYSPWTIKASNSLLCVESGSPVGMYFYSINDLSLKHKYNHGYCRISEIDSCFYEFFNTSKNVYCYDANGDLIEELKLSGIDNIATHCWDGVFLNFNGNIIMACQGTKKFIKF